MDDTLLAELAIARLQRSYADAGTRHAWDELAALATTDCPFQLDTGAGEVIELIGGRAFAEMSVTAIEQFSFHEYVPLNHVVEIDAAAGRARGRTYSYEIATDRQTGEVITFYGLYHDDYLCVDGSWLFARRQYQTLARRRGAEALVSFPLRERPQ
jgi:hypothetical protein